VSSLLLGCLSGAAFGALAVTVRQGLALGVEVKVGAAATTIVATFLSTAVMLAAGTGADDFSAGRIWPFLAVGALVPGFSQVLFGRAVRDAGPSRAAILIGTSPVLSAAIAIAVLGEAFHPLLAAGTVLVVAGGALLAWERARPEGFRLSGALLALTCAVLFAGRDNAVRSIADGSSVPGLVAGTFSLAAAALVLVSFVALAGRGYSPTEARRALVAFLPAGVSLAVAYDALVTALDRGSVTIVAPLNATQSLWAVVFSLVLLRRTDRVSRRLLIASSLVVAGGAVIGAVR
jgi:drug/metabolite transporter (DMT)-like permease